MSVPTFPFLSPSFQRLPPDSPYWATWIATQVAHPEQLAQVLPHLHGDQVAKGIEQLVSPVGENGRARPLLQALQVCCQHLPEIPRSSLQRVALSRALFRLIRPDRHTPDNRMSGVEQVKVLLPVVEWRADPVLANRLLEQAAKYGVLPAVWDLLKDRYDPTAATVQDSLPLAVVRGKSASAFTQVPAIAKEALALTPPVALGAAFIQAVLQQDAGMVECLVPYMPTLPVSEIRASFSGPFAQIEEEEFIRTLNEAIASTPEWLSSSILGGLAKACQPFQEEFPALKEVFNVLERADHLARRPATASAAVRRRI